MNAVSHDRGLSRGITAIGAESTYQQMLDDGSRQPVKEMKTQMKHLIIVSRLFNN